MVRSVPILAVLALAGSLLITGCQSTSYSCRGNECHVTVNGVPSDLEVNDHDITVSGISGDGATLSVDGSAPQTIPVGATARVGGAEITVTSVKDQEVKFDMR
ncbi:MAG TPA: hypothetical protein VIL71_12090 [Spirillospora sp.]